MFSSRERRTGVLASLVPFVPRALVALLIVVGGESAAQSAAYPNVGRAATPKELAAWDIDVRPDFRGLPKGSGSAAKGMQVWEAKCASCHGVFGENNEIFGPIVGGTTKDDMKTGRVARLNDPSYPSRTTMMKLSSVSTLWDYINRAMPWTQPKSLSTEEVYAVTAYILEMAGVVPDRFVLSDQNIGDVQKLLPNRNGTSTAHGLWPGAPFGVGKAHERRPVTARVASARAPDVAAKACMTACTTEPTVVSSLPDFARNAHGNLAEQNRAVGAQHGSDTTRAPGAGALPSSQRGSPRSVAVAAPSTKAADDSAGADAALALAHKHTCTACHGIDNKLVGPSFRDIARKYAERADAADYLAAKAKSGGSGVWGAVPMPPQPLSEGDAKLIAQWLAGGARK